MNAFVDLDFDEKKIRERKNKNGLISMDGGRGSGACDTPKDFKIRDNDCDTPKDFEIQSACACACACHIDSDAPSKTTNISSRES